MPLSPQLASDLATTTGCAVVTDAVHTVVASDPHCLPALRTTGAVTVTDRPRHLATAVVEGRLRFHEEPWEAAWHDPCVLARGEGVVAEPRQVLAAVGAQLREPEHHGADTGCSGAGLGLDLLDPQAADATARARVGQLPPTPTITGCARARQRLTAAGASVQDLAVALVGGLDHGTGSEPSLHAGPDTEERT